MSKPFFGNVKSVLSGDTLILSSPNNPAAERTFCLAYVSAPHLKREGDEPFAFQSREFLRNLVVGKTHLELGILLQNMASATLDETLVNVFPVRVLAPLLVHRREPEM